jgi:hypothetical protein
MKNQQGRLAKVVTMLVIGTLTMLAFSSLALAQKAKEMQDAHKMMSDGWKQFNDGQRMVIKGVEMNNMVAAQAGLEDKMGPGNKVIQDGRNTATQGATLIAQGEKTYLDNKGTPSVAAQGLKMMVDGFNIAQNGKEMMKKGITMNDQVAQASEAKDKFADGNQVIQTGLQTMEGGAKLFLQGEALVLKK